MRHARDKVNTIQVERPEICCSDARLRSPCSMDDFTADWFVFGGSTRLCLVGMVVFLLISAVIHAAHETFLATAVTSTANVFPSPVGTPPERRHGGIAGFIRVNVFTRFFAKNSATLLHHRHTGLTTNEDRR